MQEICVCILNYNNSRLTVKCLESVLSQRYEKFRLVITDNASTDDSVDSIKNYLDSKGISYSIKTEGDDLTLQEGESPEVVLIRSLKNGGFSYGSNRSIAFVQANNRFSHMLLLNNDVILEDHFLSGIMQDYNAEAEANPDRPLAMGAIEKGPGGNTHHTGLHFLNIPTGLVFASPLLPSFRYIVGACLFLPADAPIMDEKYFLYYDDAEYAKILLRNNFILRTSARASYIHDTGSTTRNDPQLYRIIFRSMKRFYKKNYPMAYPLVILLRFLLDMARGRFSIASEIIRSSFRKE